MDIGQGNFPILSFAQANPFLTGAQVGQDMVTQGLKQRDLQQEIQKAMLANQLQRAVQPSEIPAHIAQNQAIQKYFGPQMAADLQKSQLQNQYYAPNIQSEIDARKALTKKTGVETQLAPFEAILKAQQENQQTSRFGAAFEMSRALNSMAPAARDTWIANHQDEYNQMISDLGNKTNNRSLLTPEVMNKFFPGMGQNMPQQSQVPQLRFSNDTPENVQKTQLANQMAANNALTTVATRRQQEGAIQVGSLMNSPDVQQQVLSASEYAGAMGRGKAALAAFSQQNPKAYEDYIALKYQTMPLLLNRIKTLDAMGATNAQRETLENMYSKTIDALTSNPSQFIKQYNQFGQTLDNVAKSVQKSATPINDVNRIEPFKPIENNKYSDEDIAFTAKKYGMTIDQVKQKLGIK